MHGCYGALVRPGGLLEVGLWGANPAGTRADEHGRFFQHRSDNDVRTLLQTIGSIEAFDTWEWRDGGGHYQWAKVTVD